jgi:hypothetical protein
LYIGDGGKTQFIDLSRNLKNIASIRGSGNMPFLTDGGSALKIRARSAYFGGTYANDGASDGEVDAESGFRVGGTLVIDSSRNLANIGTISSGAITSSGTVTATSFSGDGSNITGVISEWDGTLTGNATITSDGSNADGAQLNLKHANNNSTDTIGTIFFGNNADATLSKIVAETNGANNTSNLKFGTSNAGTMGTALTLNADNSAVILETCFLSSSNCLTPAGVTASVLFVPALASVVVAIAIIPLVEVEAFGSSPVFVPLVFAI